jgi:ADP-ribose pyrophosphatase
MTNPHEMAQAISTRAIHHGRVIDVVVDTVRFPDGTVGELDIVRHPGACAVLPFLGDPTGADPSLLMIRQYRHAAGGWLLEIPAGRLDPGEAPDDCARRELLEETGCTAGRLELLTTILTTPGFSNERIHLFMAAELTAGVAHREADEFIEPHAIALSEALGKIRTGEIVDGKTIVAILFAAGFRLNR